MIRDDEPLGVGVLGIRAGGSAGILLSGGPLDGSRHRIATLDPEGLAPCDTLVLMVEGRRVTYRTRRDATGWVRTDGEYRGDWLAESGSA
jgi:hypothetical protein